MLTIGKVAERAQVTTDAIRFYERVGLIRPVEKSKSGYRLYKAEAVRRIGFIKHAQECGFSLAEIRELLELRSDDRSCCDDVYQLAVQKKLHVEGRIKALRTMSRALSELIERCSHDKKPLDACPIIDALEKELARPRPDAAPRANDGLQTRSRVHAQGRTKNRNARRTE